jgi:hypothetical protein
VTFLHLQSTNRGTYCGQRANASLNLRFIIAHMELAAVLMWAFGCRRCVDALGKSVATARPIR